MKFFNPETKEQKLQKAMEGFEIHVSDATIHRRINKSKFIMKVGLNTYELLRDTIEMCKRNDYNGIVGLKMTPSGGLGGAAAVILYATAVTFEN